MMRALQPEIYDTLFRLVADRIPAPPEHPKGGCRRRIDDAVCFRGIFWRFVTGAAWETIEVLMEFQVSDTTLRSRRSEWVDAGVFDELMEHALAEYDRIVGVDVSHVMIDGSSQLAPGGGPDTGRGERPDQDGDPQSSASHAGTSTVTDAPPKPLA